MLLALPELKVKAVAAAKSLRGMGAWEKETRAGVPRWSKGFLPPKTDSTPLLALIICQTEGLSDVHVDLEHMHGFTAQNAARLADGVLVNDSTQGFF